MTTTSPKALVELTANELRHHIGTREISPVELLDACIARIEAVNPHVNAVTATCYDRARTEAKAAEQVEVRDSLGNLLADGDKVVTTGAYSLAFAGKGSVSLKEALDAAHGHEHNEDGSEVGKDQKTAGHAEGDGHDHRPSGGTKLSGLTLFSLIGNGVLLVLLVVGSATFRNLPQATLAAVVISAALRMFTIAPVARLARIRHSEFLLSMAAFVAVALGFGGVLIVVGPKLSASQCRRPMTSASLAPKRMTLPRPSLSMQ